MASSYISLRHIVATLQYVKNKKPHQNNTVLVGFFMADGSVLHLPFE